MPLSIHASALAQEKSLMPQVFPGQSEESGRNAEDVRRRATATPAAAVVAPVVSSPSIGGATPIAKPPVQQAIIDRLHKESGSVYGGYVFVGTDHDASEANQVPPTNPGWRTSGVTVSSIADAYAKAIIMKSIATKTNARIAIIILASQWTEAINVNVAGIDFFGEGCPSIYGKITVGPVADTRFYNLDTYALDDLGGLALGMYPVDTDPRILPSVLKNVRCFGPQTAFSSQRRFYAENCQFHQTSRVDVVLEIAACVINIAGPVADFITMKDCKFFASNEQPVESGIAFNIPYGFAISATSIGGNMATLLGGGQCFITPNSGLILDNCEVMGSLLCSEWMVEHKGGRQHGGIPISTGAGRAYARLRGHPVFNSVDGYLGSNPAWVTFDNVSMHSAVIAQFVPWNGVYPVGVTPSDYPGVGYVAFRHSPHLMRFDGAAGQPFINAGTSAFADIVTSSTGCSSWNGTTVTTLFGTCPVNVTGNRELYMI